MAKTYSKGITGLRQAEKKFRVFTDSNSLSSINKNFTKIIADALVKNIKINYNAFVNSLGRDFQDRSDTNIYAIEEENGYEVRAVGRQIIYDEFGTGDKGDSNRHPNKGRYSSLQPYNSGPRIIHGKSGNYWWYKSPVDLKYHTSHGVPSGQFMYRGLENTASELSMYQSDYMVELQKMLGAK